MSNPAETYESYMVPTLFEPWASHLLDLAALAGGESLLDVGCGTGIVARRAARRVGGLERVVGVDLSSEMLAVARAAAEREGVEVEWREGRAEALPFPDESFDCVSSQAALMFFADRPAALAEMRRVLKKTGRASSSVFEGLDRHPFYRSLDEAIQRSAGTSALQDIFSLGDGDELRSLFADAGFGRVRIESMSLTARFPEPESFLAGEIAVDTASIPSMQHLNDEDRAAITEAIRHEMQPALRDVTEDGHVVLTFHTRLTLATP